MTQTRAEPTAPDPALHERRAGDAARLQRWEAWSRIPILLAAVIPLVGVVRPERTDWVSVTIDFASWLVFLADLVVHVRLRRGYLRTGRGLFDIAIVLLTFPWYVIPGVNDNSKVLAVLRLSRLARVVVATWSTGRAARMVSRVNTVVIVAIISLLLCSLVAYEAEKPRNGFDNIWDALWWGIVTLTTVGYGDIVPETLTGRLAGAVLMVTGIAVLGGLAAVLSSFFGLQDEATEAATGERRRGGAVATPAPTGSQTIDALHEEVVALRREVAELNRRLGGGDRSGAGP